MYHSDGYDHNGGGYACLGAQGIGEISLTSDQFCGKSKNTLKN